MKSLFIAIFVSFNFLALSQTKIIQKKLNWQKINDNEQILAKFDNCSFLPNGLPFYDEIFLLDTIFGSPLQNDVEIVIQNIQFEPHNFQITNKINVPDSISVKKIVGTGREKKFAQISFLPIIGKNNLIYRVVSFEIKFEIHKSTSRAKTPKYAENSLLSSGKWIKLPIVAKGVYKLTFSQLQNMGFSEPSKVRVFGYNQGNLSYMNNAWQPDDLIELPIFKSTDYIIFYAEASSIWKYDTAKKLLYNTANTYTDTAYIFLSDIETNFNNQISQIQQTPEEGTEVNIGTFALKYEKELVNLTKSGRIWLGEDFIFETSRNISLEIPNILTNTQSRAVVTVAARAPSASSMVIKFANQTFNLNFTEAWGYDYQKYVDYKTIDVKFIPNSSKIDFLFSYNKPNSSANAWIDYIIINAKCNLNFYNRMIFYNLENVGDGKITKFKITNAPSNAMVLDITDPRNPKIVSHSYNNGTITFNVYSDTIRQYTIFTPQDCPSPIIKPITIPNQNLHNINTNVEMLIITHPQFLNQANKIAQIHKDYDNITCQVVDVVKIYNEFSSGMKDACAIRNYIRMVYNKTNKGLKYVLLFGDGTYDNKSPISSANPNFIPTYQSEETFNIYDISFTTDDFYGLLDDNEGEFYGFLDVTIGRLTVKNTDEANLMVNKIISYYKNSNSGDWQNIVTFVADDRDKIYDDFVSDCEYLANFIDNNWNFINIKKIYLDSYQQITSAYGQEYPQAVIDLNNRINNGTLIVNYIGHGSEQRLSSEGIINKTSILKWNNFDKLTLFITGTCKFSRFDNADANEDPTSGGEMLLLDKDGSAIGLISTARVSYALSNLIFIKNLYQYLFNQPIGLAYMNAKNSTSGNNKLFYTLLCDPALKLPVPENRVVLTKINDSNAFNFHDTVKALTKLKIEGIITNKHGEKINNFNGDIIINLLDKKISLSTLNNDGNGSMNYWSQFVLLNKTKSKVTNGLFTAEIYIPKDIYYHYDKGKLSFFATDNKISANGAFNNFILGGINQQNFTDSIGPEIKIFINDTNFVNGGTTNPDPKFIIKLKDESGINLSNASLGHEITAILDNDNNKTYNLTEYYEPINDKEGKIHFTLNNLTPALHTIKINAYDVFNNPSQKSLSFNVVDNKKLEITRLYNYPNPFTTKTSFFIEYNKTNTQLYIVINIFTVSGKKIKTLTYTTFTTGNRTPAIEWDGRDDFGQNVAKGVYFYTATITTNKGEKAKKTEKLLIL